MKPRLLARSLAPFLSALAAMGFAQASPELAEAWRAWENGDIPRAGELARAAAESESASDEARHLLFLAEFASGRYRSAIDCYRQIGEGYRRRSALNEVMLDAFVHLGELEEALQFARSRKGIEPALIRQLEAHVARPFQVVLAGLAEVPFADHPLRDYFPAFDGEINGRKLAAHVDTGGMFLHMGPERAKALGISTVAAGKGPAHLNRAMVDWSHGIAESFALGPVVMRNVPVSVLDTLKGENDYVIFGTNVLDRFLATLDYPRSRLILSVRGDAPAAAEHAAILPPQAIRVPFYLWGDHYMFARGSAAGRSDLNFFVDSGLLSLHPDGKGGVRQASFTTSKRKLRQWGIPETEIGKGFFELGELGLGPITEPNPIVVVGEAGDTSFGGVRIDGLISHGFLKRYVWTLDFDKREYRFAPDPSPGKP